MNMLVPDIVLSSVRDITPDWMAAHSLRVLLLDLDNTLAGYHANEPLSEIADWLKHIREAGYTVIVLSNAGVKRVAAFCEPLKLPYVAKARKPKAEALLEACGRAGIEPRNAAMVGDQIFTDVLSANRAGVMSVIVEPLTSNILFNLRRRIESRFINATLNKIKGER